MPKSNTPVLDRRLLDLTGREKLRALMSGLRVRLVDVASHCGQHASAPARALDGTSAGDDKVWDAFASALDIPRSEVDSALGPVTPTRRRANTRLAA